ncbi:hypothetical protein PYW08_002700 [Mythimna loreyi]|uniref:Uncharacterized protein n=1 Tax=Mythimna loreyi TaxID=667449 RepID=A0ACC2QLB0_9NEOP|nr:hypothetical protein PYW08_002700 [Mythimna loreyi]
MSASLNRLDMQQVEFRAVIKFLTKQGKGPQAILNEMKAVYGPICPGKTMIYKWCSAFQNGRETIEDKPRTLIHKRGRGYRERRALSPIFDDSFIDKIQNELLDAEL